ncbi:protein FANTASTIC FOUR 1 [Heracleum sosnowskyi]|uniref:Protein FANTASTIC FOUR 1 n=1 Tax=Heracleum sosnowskyi TaxID=360622 RepID=A0AAD8HPQ7_9APIA|nr:protein FANTASTIC FOUR 1 [Heracleum sosnowskyi]
MISFSKKSFNTLFYTASTALPPGEDSSFSHHHITPLPVTNCGAGLNFLTTSGKIPKPNNVIVSPSLINSPVKSDQIETGPKVLNSGDMDRLASCTESLGFESCNEKNVNNDFENSEKSRVNDKSKNSDKKNKGIKNKSFPPPLSSFDANGKPTFFLHPVRSNGRLELIKVNINRQERLRALREDGRLSLPLVESDHKNSEMITSTDVVGEKSSDKDKFFLKELKFPVSNGGGED